jgi:hypothetical protein
MSDIIKVVIGFNRTSEEIDYIDSDFMKEGEGFKDPIGYTAKLIQMGLEKWIREKIGISCPKCDGEFKEGWQFCPNCGWNPDE